MVDRAVALLSIGNWVVSQAGLAVYVCTYEKLIMVKDE
jgi:hypothetical protein